MNTSLNRVMRNLNKEIKQIEKLSMAGLIEGVAEIRRDMDKTPPLIPIDTGNLRASWESIPVYYKNKPVVIAGFTANYAVFVHEMVGANFNRPGAGAKFYEASINRNHQKLLEILQERSKIQ